MKITYATDINADNIHNWSGLGWYYGKMLEQAGCDVTIIDKASMPDSIIHKIKKHFIKSVQRKLYSQRFNIEVSKYYAKCIHEKVVSGTTILSPNTVVLAYLKKDLKKVLFSDATFDSLLHLYPTYREFTDKCLKEGQQIDQLAVNNADLLIYTSKWAADSAINHYGADPGKVHIVPFGANLDNFPTPEELKRSIASRLSSKNLNLLFLGVDWKRKGGDIALQVVTKLNELGIPATLHIVGATNLPHNVNKKFIINHGYISKATPEGQRRISSLLVSSHFLLLPTIADCTPVACSEANAFGVPCVTSNVGGLKSIIKDDINGHTFPLHNFVNDAVQYIIGLKDSEIAYKELCCASYYQYATELNWKSVGSKITKLIQTI